MKIFNKILIANRGEIAVRIMKTAARLNARTVAIYAENDADSLHVQLADESYSIGDGTLQETYLNINKIIELAIKTECDAIHPGYGFLSENSKFVAACKEANITFIGPDAQSMALMGDKIRARKVADDAGVPITKGITGNTDEIMQQIDKLEFPVLVKASAGGGGKGMRIVTEKKAMKEALEATSREAATYFGDGTVYIEKFLEEPRHIEIQILADHHGNAVYLFERECSIQRRYQKIIEEAPSPTLSPELRHQMGTAAVELVKKIGYRNAGTIEFLVDKKLQFYFLEMNTRIQVEHPVTEMISGVDIVEEQLYIAAGNVLRIKQDDLKIKGHAIESRIYAEDPENNFLPSPGTLTLYAQPEGDNIRVDAGIDKAVEIKSQYDPMIAKLIVWAEDRENAIRRMNYALRHFRIQGIKTNIPYLIKLVENEQYNANKISTKFCDLYTDDIIEQLKLEKERKGFYLPFIAYWLYSLMKNNEKATTSVWQSIGYWRNMMQANLLVENQNLSAWFSILKNDVFEFAFEDATYLIKLKKLNKNRMDFTIGEEYHKACISEDNKGYGFVSMDGLIYNLHRKDRLFDTESPADFMDNSGTKNNKVSSPMPGKVIKINVKEGDSIHKGDVLLIVEAMKMENSILAPVDGTIEAVFVNTNDMVDGVKELVKIKPKDE
jgi:3-methylcrotonyl-CoA carboxylase alpha subunit